MGKNNKNGKKKNSTPSTSDAPPDPTQPPPYHIQDAALQAEIIRVLHTFRSDGFDAAKQLAEEAPSRRARKECLAFLHRLNAASYFACLMDIPEGTDEDARSMYFSESGFSIGQALYLSPRSIEYCHYYASTLLLMTAKDNDDYEFVIEKCREALAIPKPVDPFWLGDVNERLRLFTTPEARLDYVKRCLKLLIDRCESRKKATKETAQETGAKLRRAESFWEESMSVEERRSFLEVKMEDLKKRSSDDKLVLAFLSMVSNFAKQFAVVDLRNRWSCYICRRTFLDPDAFVSHAKETCIPNPLSQSLQDMLPSRVCERVVDLIQNCCWEPIDTNAALKMIEEEQEEQLRNGRPVLVRSNGSDCDDFCGNFYTDSSEDYLLESSDVSQKWPLSGDLERIELLKKVQDMLTSLIEHNYLSTSHVDAVIRLAIYLVRRLPSGSRLVSLLPFRELRLCFCFQGAPQLKLLYDFLSLLSLAGEPDSENDVLPSDIVGPEKEQHPNIFFSPDLSRLILDSKSFQGRPLSDDAGSSGTNDDIENLVTTKLLSCIFYGSSLVSQFQSWVHVEEAKPKKTEEICQKLDDEFELLRDSVEERREYLVYMEAMKTLGNHCIDELKRRGQAEEPKYDFGTVLRNRKQELEKIDLEPDKSKSECEAIADVLRKVEHMNNTGQFECEGSSGLTAYLRKLDSGDEYDNRMQDPLFQADSSVNRAIRWQCQDTCLKLNINDAEMLQILTRIQKQYYLLKSTSCTDCHSVVLPLITTILRSRLEGLIKKDDEEKKNALLKELMEGNEVDAEKNVSKLPKDKMNDKKNRKNNRKAKDTGSPMAPDHYEDGEVPDATSYPISDAAKAQGSIDHLKQEEDKEGFRQNVENEAKQEQTEKPLEWSIEDFLGNILWETFQLDLDCDKSSFPDDDDDDDDDDDSH